MKIQEQPNQAKVHLDHAQIHAQTRTQTQAPNQNSDFEGFFDEEHKADSPSGAESNASIASSSHNQSSLTQQKNSIIDTRLEPSDKQQQLLNDKLIDFENNSKTTQFLSKLIAHDKAIPFSIDSIAKQQLINRLKDVGDDISISSSSSQVIKDLWLLQNIECGELALKQDAFPNISCTPEPDAFNPCEDIMGYPVLRVAVWFVVACSIFGNLSVILVLMAVHKHLSVPKFLQLNLAFGDLFMGVYLAMLATADLITVGTYFDFAMDWQHGYGCKIAGATSLFASQLSIFTLSVITFERYYTITYSIDLNMRLQLGWASRIMIFGWLFAFLSAMLPNFADINSYNRTSICLPMRTTYLSDRIFILILLVIDSSAFIIIFACYLKMYLLIIRQKTEATAKERTVAMRMALLVSTDFACWAPIIFFSTTALLGKPLISVTNSKILIVFFYPLNSMANPFLYVITTRQYRRDLNFLFGRWQTWRANVFSKKSDSYYNNNNDYNNNYGIIQYPACLNAHLGAVAAVTGVANHLRHNHIHTSAGDEHFDCNREGIRLDEQIGGPFNSLNRTVCTKSHHGQYIIRHQILTDKNCLTIDDRHRSNRQKRILRTAPNSPVPNRATNYNVKHSDHDTCAGTICNHSNDPTTASKLVNVSSQERDLNIGNAVAGSSSSSVQIIRNKQDGFMGNSGSSVQVRVNDETNGLQKSKYSDKIDKEVIVSCQIEDCSSTSKNTKTKIQSSSTNGDRAKPNKHRRYDSFAGCCNRCCRCCSSSRCSSIQGNQAQLNSNVDTRTTEILTKRDQLIEDGLAVNREDQTKSTDETPLANLETTQTQTQKRINNQVESTLIKIYKPPIDNSTGAVNSSPISDQNKETSNKISARNKQKKYAKDLDSAVDILGNLSYNEPTSSVSGISSPPTSGQLEICKIIGHLHENINSCPQYIDARTNSSDPNSLNEASRRIHSCQHQYDHRHDDDDHHHRQHQHRYQHQHHKHHYQQSEQHKFRQNQDHKSDCKCEQCIKGQKSCLVELRTDDSRHPSSLSVDAGSSSHLNGELIRRHHCCRHKQRQHQQQDNRQHRRRHHRHHHNHRLRSHTRRTQRSRSPQPPDLPSNSGCDFTSPRRTSHESHTSGQSIDLNSNNSGQLIQQHEQSNDTELISGDPKSSVIVKINPAGQQRELESILKPTKQVAEISESPKGKGSNLLSLFRGSSFRRDKQSQEIKSAGDSLRSSQSGKKRVSIIAHHSG